MVPPGAGRRAECRNTFVTAKALANGIGHVSAAPAGPRDAIQRLDKILRQQQVCAHMITHDAKVRKG